jgi:hypothetical protein
MPLDGGDMLRNRFRILNIGDGLKGFSESWRHYQEFLRNINRNRHPDLWRYFRRDFFHDGLIRDFSFSSNFSKLSFVASCLNIRHRSDEIFQKNGYCEVDFLCTFYPVWFQLDVDESEEGAPGSELFFSNCEINTLVEDYEPKLPDCDYGSLIIYISDVQKYLSIIFTGLNVQPVEPAAYYQMLASGQFIIPMFEDDDA